MGLYNSSYSSGQIYRSFVEKTGLRGKTEELETVTAFVFIIKVNFCLMMQWKPLPMQRPVNLKRLVKR